MQWITIALLGTLAGYVACDMKSFLRAAENCEGYRNADILKGLSFCKTQVKFYNCLSDAVFHQNVKFHHEPHRVLFALKEACTAGRTLQKELQISADCTLETIQDFSECIDDISPLLAKSIEERSKILCPQGILLALHYSDIALHYHHQASEIINLWKLASISHCMQASVKNKCKKVSSNDFFLTLVEPILSFQKRLCQLLTPE